MDTILRLIGILTLVVSVVWLIVQPGFEPLMTLLSGVVAFFSSYAIRKIETSQELHKELRDSNVPGVEGRTITKPKLLRYLFDRYFPRIHTFLATKIGLFELPPEWRVLHDYLSTLHSTIENDIREKTYVEPYAKALPENVIRVKAKRTGFLTPIQQLIKEIVGISHGGDAQSAQISALSKKSRFVRDIVKLLSTADEPLILLGDPGTGKSITLQQAAMLIAEHESKRLFPNVCVFVRLGEFHIPTEITSQSVWEYVKRSTPEDIRPYLDSLDALGRLIIFFDGMDEMSRDRYDEYTTALSIFAGSRKGITRTLFSCRITDFTPRFQHNRLVLLPFDRKHIYQYIKRQIPYFPIKIGERTWSASELASRLAKGDLPMQADNPFVLWLLCNYLQKEEDWPKSRVHLLEYYNRLNYQRKVHDSPQINESMPDMDSAFFTWGKIAYEITTRNLGVAIPLRDVESLLTPYELPAVQAGIQCGILQKSMETETTLLRFEHHRFQEYFTALYIDKDQKVKSELKWLDKLDAPRWQETLFNLVLMGGGWEALSALEQAIHQGHETLKASGEAGKTIGIGQDETLLADRVELTSRILQQIQKQADGIMSKLSATFKNVTYWLSDHGNPITQVKMLWAARLVQGIDIFRVARASLSSDVSWVRQQALIITSLVTGGVGTGALKEDMLHSFASGRFLNRFDGFIRVATGLKQKRFWAFLGIGFTLHLVQWIGAVLLIVAAYNTMIPTLSGLEKIRQLGWEPQFVWLGMEPTERGVSTEMTTRTQFEALLPTLQQSLDSRWFPLITAGIMLATMLYTFRWAPGLQVLTVQSIGYVCLILPFIWWMLWFGYGMLLLYAILWFLPTILFIGSVVIWAGTLLIHVATLVLFMISTYGWKAPVKPRMLMEAMWENTGYGNYTIIIMACAFLPLFALLIMFVFWLIYLVRTILFFNLFPFLPPIVGTILSLITYLEVIGLLVGIVSALKERDGKQGVEVFLSWTKVCIGLAALVLAGWGLWLVDWLAVWTFIVTTLGLFPNFPSLVNVSLSLLIYAEIVGFLTSIWSAFKEGDDKRSWETFILWTVTCAVLAIVVFVIWGIASINWSAIWAFIVSTLGLFPMFSPLVNVTLSLSLYAEVITCITTLLSVRKNGWGQSVRIFIRWTGIWLALMVITLLIWAGYLSQTIAIILFTSLVAIILFMFRPLFLAVITSIMILGRPMIRSKYTREMWKQDIRTVNPGSQVTILRRTTPGSLDLSVHEYLALLYEIEGSITEEPALSAYWAKRYQIEQIIRQEKIG